MKQLEIIPHPLAPLFDREDGMLILSQIMDELDSQNPSFGNNEVRSVMRQAGFVSLWFFLKGIASHGGPFDLLNEELHMDMANFRQKLLYPGCRGAMFIPRSTFKTTIVTEGGSAWEAVRFPDIRIRITNAISDKAQDFMHTVKNIFDSNELFAMLYPEYVPANNAPRWNNTEIVLPNRTKKRREATVEYGGVGGASEGHHYDLHVVDDMIGLGALNSMQQSGAEMMRTRNWFWGSEKTLLQSVRNSRVIVVGTRYAIDDVYDDIIDKAYENVGYPLRDFVPNPKGRWSIYYRKALENDESIFPEGFSKEDLEEMAEDDYWTYVTQYLNDPQAAGLAEFNEIKIKKCLLTTETINVGGDSFDRWLILYTNNGVQYEVPLETCDLIFAVDPAASERRISAKTSRTALVVMATDPKGNHFILKLQADYIKVSQMFKWLQNAKRQFGSQVRCTFLESQGAFKMLYPLLLEDQERNGYHVNPRPLFTPGDKDARIRTTMQPVLEAGKLFIVEEYYELFWEEQRSFPQSMKKDILDATSMALMGAVTPVGEEEKSRVKSMKSKRLRSKNPVTGY